MTIINMQQSQPEVGRYSVTFTISEGEFPDQLKDDIQQHIGQHGYCVFVGSSRSKLAVGSNVNNHPTVPNAALEVIKKELSRSRIYWGLSGKLVGSNSGVAMPLRFSERHLYWGIKTNL